MAASVSWFIYCDDCAEMTSDGDQGFGTASTARMSARKHGGGRRRMRDGKLYDFCHNCIADREDREDDSPPTEAR